MILDELLNNNQLSFILDQSEEDKFFIWLYVPIEILSLVDIINLANKFKVSFDIIIFKIISGYLYNGYDDDKIINLIIDNQIINDLDIDYLKAIIQECKLYNFNPLDRDIIYKILLISKNINYSNFISDKKIKSIGSDVIHTNYPLPDPILGRPRLIWMECYFQNCHKVFKDTTGLRNHLLKLGKLTHGFHYFHEKAVEELKLTKNKIIEQKLNKCPSIICDKKNKVFTGEELIEHLKILGIPPFWEIGMKFKENNIISVDKPLLKKIFTIEECLICLDLKPMILFLPCYHNVICLNCILKVSSNFVCPVCRNNIKNFMPF